MTWNYRVFKDRRVTKLKGRRKPHVEETFTIHEMYYRKNGKPWAYSTEPDAPTGSTLDELRECLIMMLRDTYRAPVVTKKNWRRWRGK